MRLISPFGINFRVLLFSLLAGQPLPFPEVEIIESFRDNHATLVFQGNRFCSLHCPFQWTGINSFYLPVSEVLSQHLSLFLTCVVKRYVQPAAENIGDVKSGLAVSDKNYFGHFLDIYLLAI